MIQIRNQFDFTVITPVFNAEDWIRETVESVLSTCSKFSFEYLVINDGSTDATGEVLKKFEKKIRVIEQANSGEASAVNRGIELARGKYIIVVSADDPMRSPELFEKALDFFASNEELVCVYPDWSVIDSKSNVIRNIQVPEFSDRKLIGEFTCIVGPGGIFKRDQAIEIGGRDTQYRFTSDYDFWLRLSRKGKFQRIPGYFAFWRDHENSTSIALRGREMGIERIEVMRNFLTSHSEVPKKLQKMARGYSHYHAALLVYFDPKVPSKRWLFRALSSYPQGVFKFSPRVLAYILLTPLSPYLLKMMNKLGFFQGR